MAWPLHTMPSLAELVCRQEGGRHVIDLSNRPWVDPAHLVGAASLAHSHVVAGVPLQVMAPQASDQHQYAARMHLGRVLDDLEVEHDFPTRGTELDRSDDLLEVRPIRGEADACALAGLVATKVRDETPAAADALFACVAEMAENVADHSGVVGYVAAQTFPRMGAVKFAVADAGQGLRATLSVRGATTDEQALEMAVAGVSRFDDPSRGTGLPTTMRELVGMDGSMYVASGTAAFRARGAERTCRARRAAFPGTLVQGVLRVRGPAPPRLRRMPTPDRD